MRSQTSKSDRTRTRILDAVEALSANGPMSAITMRSIADEAGCSLGLAYRYYETKEQLIGAVLDRAAAHITDAIDPDYTPEELAQHAWTRMTERPVFARLFAWLILEQQDVTALMSRHPFMSSAIQQASKSGDPDPFAAATTLSTIVLGNGFFGPAIAQVAGRQPSDEVTNRMTRAIAATQQPPNPRP